MDLVKKRSGVELKFYDLASKIVKENGYELYDLDYVSGSSTLRVFILDLETSSALIEDCVKVDRGFSSYCETESWIPDDFVLEVSSPGVYRVMKTFDHFKSAIDDFVEFTITGRLDADQSVGLSKQDANKSMFRAKVLEVSNENIKIEYVGQEVLLSFKQIKKANLDPDLNS